MDPADVSKYVIEGDAEAATEWTRRALDKGMDPLVIVNQGLIPGMDVVGQKFQDRDYFMPELLVAARAMKSSMALVKSRSGQAARCAQTGSILRTFQPPPTAWSARSAASSIVLHSTVTERVREPPETCARRIR